ncbi:MAG: GTP cyclohydrolase I FolE [Bacteroidales bacterium]|nr:GTP cyclohydrolase I FolE [Bacteroidales bacterium]
MSYSNEELYSPSVTEEIAVHVREILRLLGEDPGREGLEKTPERVAKALQFSTKGYRENGVEIIRKALFNEDYRQMVLVKDIDLYSTCEHHLMPFIGKCHVAYIPDGTITGISKIARVVESYARRLQVQERLTVQICDCIVEALHPLGAAVLIEAAHTCMQTRGVLKGSAVTTTCEFRGVFNDSDRYRSEFLRLIGQA